MKKTCVLVGVSMAVWAMVAGLARAGGPVSLASLLEEMTDRTRVARYPEPAYRTLQASSYDRASTDPKDAATWFANNDFNQFVRTEENAGRKEWVMMDADGPGAVVRIWSPNPTGVLRVYVDGGATPVIEADMAQLLSGTLTVPRGLAAEASKGWNIYLPIPFAKHCKVTSDKDGFYYHVNYRVYAAGTAVESVTPEILKVQQSRIDGTSSRLVETRRADATVLKMQTPIEIGAGESKRFELPPGSRAVRAMNLRLIAPAMEQALRSCVVEMSFDGERTVWCPVADFFGSGVGVNAYQDWYRRVREKGGMTCEWVMPYRERGELVIHNLGADPVRVEELGFATKEWTWDERSMHFHAVWRDEYPIHAEGAKGTSDFNYVDVQGKGVYVGDNLSVMNPVKEWWGEGDEKIYVDGEKFPSHFGTGTEDYYGYGWCWPVKFARPFEAQVRCDGQEGKNNWGRTAVTRTRSLDAIPFETSLSMNIEVWHWKACDVEYATTAYYYALPGARDNRGPTPEQAAKKLVEAPALPKPFKVQGAFECEGLNVAAASPGLKVEAQGGFGPGVWSGDQHLWVQSKAVGEFVEFTLDAPKASQLAVYATRSWDYGVVRFTVNGKPAGLALDLCSHKHEVQATGRIDLGVFAPVDGKLVIRAEVAAKSAGSEGLGTYFGLDCFVVEAVK